MQLIDFVLDDVAVLGAQFLTGGVLPDGIIISHTHDDAVASHDVCGVVAFEDIYRVCNQFHALARLHDGVVYALHAFFRYHAALTVV